MGGPKHSDYSRQPVTAGDGKLFVRGLGSQRLNLLKSVCIEMDNFALRLLFWAHLEYVYIKIHQILHNVLPNYDILNDGQ